MRVWPRTSGVERFGCGAGAAIRIAIAFTPRYCPRNYRALMQFLTIRDTINSEFRKHFSGGRPFMGVFHYHLEPDPSAERLTVRAQLAPDAREAATVKRFFPAFAEGVLSSIDFEETRGCRLCCVRAEVTDMRSHPDATFSDGVYLSGNSFYRELLSLAKPIEPLRDEWLTSDVIALARGIHTDAAHDRYPILSDALQDAGCDDPLIRDHLQMCPDHGPSCWVVEMILDQSAAR